MFYSYILININFKYHNFLKNGNYCVRINLKNRSNLIFVVIKVHFINWNGNYNGLGCHLSFFKIESNFFNFKKTRLVFIKMGVPVVYFS